MFYGIDLSKESFKAALLPPDGDELQIIGGVLYGEGFERFKNQLSKNDYVAVEASTNTFWFVEQIRNLVHECYVIDPFRFSLIYKTPKKTDRIDARKIAHKLKYYVLYDRSEDEFPVVFVPSKAVQELRSLLTTYDLLKREQVMTKNRIRSILAQNGFFGLKALRLSLKKHQRDLLALPLSKTLQTQISILFDVLNMQEANIKSIKDAVIVQSASFRKEVDILTSIKGISPFVAAVLMADIADVHRFKNAKHFCSYLRAAPKVDASGDSTRIGRINKHSRRMSMSVLVECINHFRESSPRLNAFYERKAEGKAKGKVRIAVVRKVLVAIYHMLRREEFFCDMDRKNHDHKMREFEKIVRKAA